MMPTVKRLSILAIILAAFCYVPHATAQSLSTNGYVTPEAGTDMTVIGMGVELSTNTACGNATPSPSTASITFYASSSPDTQGSAIGTYNLSESGYPWVPETAGTYYISAYLSLNGAVGCTGYEISSPETIEIIVSNP